MLKSTLATGSARMSRVVNGDLLSQKKSYIACSVSVIAQVGTDVGVAVYHKVEVSRPLMTSVLPL